MSSGDLMRNRNYGSNLGSVIGSLVVVFLGFLLVFVLLAQASIVNLVTGQVTLANSNVFFGMIFGSLFCVMLGSYLMGKYLEKYRREKESNLLTPSPP